MDSFVLDAHVRAKGDKPNAVRLSGKIPAVYYGKGQESRAIALGAQNFRKVFGKAGENTIIELVIDGKKFPVLVHDVQYDALSDAVSHVDFIHVDMSKEVTTSVKITVAGVAPAVKNLGGILDIQKHEIKIKCLPKDLIHSIEVDISPIVDYHTSVHVKDLKVPASIKVLDNPEDTVVTATPPRVEEETKPAEAEAPGVDGAAAVADTEGGAPQGGAAGAAQGGAAPAAAGAAKEAKK